MASLHSDIQRMSLEDKRKYNFLETELQEINRKSVYLSREEVRRNNVIIDEILNKVTTEMKKTDPLFSSMYSTVFYGGSYYDGLRVGHPEEFDLDLLLRLPKFAEPALSPTNVPGFVQVQFKALEKFLKQPEAKTYGNLTKLVDKDNYLRTREVFSWIESVVIRSMNRFPKSAGGFVHFTSSIGDFECSMRKSGPAMTLHLEGIDQRISIDIDLVPCFVFGREKWPPSPYRQHNGHKNEFFIVPKTMHNCPGIRERYWRLSFQEQEREVMQNLVQLKPALKLLKLLRDVQNFGVIASYFIKVIFLWEVDGNRSLFNANNSLSYVFVTMLKRFQEHVQNRNIPYFWHKRYNLIANHKAATLDIISNRLLSIIRDIEKRDPAFKIEKYLGKPPALVLDSYSDSALVTESSSWSCAIQ